MLKLLIKCNDKRTEIFALHIINIFLSFLPTDIIFQMKIKNYRSLSNHEGNIEKLNEKLLILESDTDNIIQYIDTNLDNNEKEYKFWELLKKLKEDHLFVALNPQK